MHRIAHSLLLGAAATAATAALADAQREAGDVLRFAMPAATFGVELVRGDTRGARQYAGALTAALTAGELLKRTTGVERPDRSNDQSFPSGHAVWAFSSATYVHRRHGFGHAWPLYLLATYTGYTRVQADRHRWADVAGGAAVAAAASWWLVEPRRPSGMAGAPRHPSIQVGYLVQW